MNKTAIALAVVAIVAAGMVVVPNLGTVHVAEAKSKTGKIRLDFDPEDFRGKAKFKVWNIDNGGKVLVKADLNVAKLVKSEGKKNCCYKVYEFKWDGNRAGDLLGWKFTTDFGYGESGEDVKLEKGTTKFHLFLEDIGCWDEPDC